ARQPPSQAERRGRDRSPQEGPLMGRRAGPGGPTGPLGPAGREAPGPAEWMAHVVSSPVPSSPATVPSGAWSGDGGPVPATTSYYAEKMQIFCISASSFGAIAATRTNGACAVSTTVSAWL